MSDTFKSFSVYANGAKYGTAQGHAYDRENNAELQIGDGEVLGVSSAVPTGQLVCDSVVPYGGNNVHKLLEDAFEKRTPVKIGIGIVNGEIHKVDAWVTKINLKSDTVKGTLNGSLTMLFGKVKRTG
jgi:hypothetical protein